MCTNLNPLSAPHQFGAELEGSESEDWTITLKPFIITPKSSRVSSAVPVRGRATDLV